ncbi:hypothetical protein P7K49_031233, partial [Saguinus oedipus]
QCQTAANGFVASLVSDFAATGFVPQLPTLQAVDLCKSDQAGPPCSWWGEGEKVFGPVATFLLVRRSGSLYRKYPGEGSSRFDRQVTDRKCYLPGKYSEQPPERIRQAVTCRTAKQTSLPAWENDGSLAAEDIEEGTEASVEFLELPSERTEVRNESYQKGEVLGKVLCCRKEPYFWSHFQFKHQTACGRASPVPGTQVTETVATFGELTGCGSKELCIWVVTQRGTDPT